MARLACALAAGLTLGGWTAGEALGAVQVYQDFDSDPGWDHLNNELVTSASRTVTQDFGYRTSNHAGAAAGEIGGTVDRSPLQAAYYGEVLPTPLTFEQPLSFGGGFSLVKATHTVGFVSSSDIYVGFFNSQEQRWRPRDFLGFRVAGNNEPVPNSASIEMSYGTDAWTADATSGLDTLAADSAKHTFFVAYDPSAGSGRMTFTWDGGAPRTLDIRAPHRAQGATFDRFGIFSNQLPGVVEGNKMEAYFDDLTINGGPVQHFATNPAWQGVGNQTTFEDPYFYGTNNFGYRTGNHAGGSPGELGGLLWRVQNTDTQFHGYYADDVGHLSMSNHLTASGKIGVERFSIDSGVMLGWFNSADQTWPPKNFVGVYMDSLTDTGRFFTPMYGTTGGMTRFANAPFPLLRPDGTSMNWTIDYDPTAAGGAGAITVTLDGMTRTLALDPGAKSNGALLDRFGLFNMQDANGKHAVVYLDDMTYTSARFVGQGQWLPDASGSWMGASNWNSAAVPNAIGAQVVFGSNNTAGRTVYANSTITAGTMTFNSPTTWLLTGLGSLRLQVASGSAQLNVLQGTHRINLPLVIASDTQLVLSGGTQLFISDPVTVAPGKSLTHSGAGTVTYQSTVTLGSGSSISLTAPAQMQALAMSADSRVDVGSSLRVNGSDYETIRSKIAQGYNGGDWRGDGITSRAAVDDPDRGTALGVSEESDGGVLVKYTYYGDANLNGSPDLGDFSRFLDGFAGGAPADWSHGDFDYSGAVDTRDFEHFVRGLEDDPQRHVTSEFYSALSGFAAAQNLDIDLSALPEPGSLLVLMAAAAGSGLLRRRHGTLERANRAVKG